MEWLRGEARVRRGHIHGRARAAAAHLVGEPNDADPVKRRVRVRGQYADLHTLRRRGHVDDVPPAHRDGVVGKRGFSGVAAKAQRAVAVKVHGVGPRGDVPAATADIGDGGVPLIHVVPLVLDGQLHRVTVCV